MNSQLLRGIAIPAICMAALLATACGDDNGTDPIDPPGEAVLSGSITANRTLYSDTVYTLRGFVKVGNGATLTVQEGTKIVGDREVPGSALFILRGAKINANGSAANPIVFTSAKEPGDRRPGDWGGLIIVGNATVNRTNVIVEGSNANIQPGGGGDGVTYSGGTDDNDNSGVLRYVRVEFAGYGVAQNQELNSFTFAAVGRGTTLEYLQSMSGLDDSFEWFGGTVDGRYLVSYESGDDHFDASEGYRGRNQFLIALQSTKLEALPGTGFVSSDPSGFEVDGCDGTGCADLHNSQPFTMPVFANFTVIGPGPGVFQTGGIGAVIRRGTGGTYINGIIGSWNLGLSVRDANTNARRLADSLIILNILFSQHPATLDASASNFTQPANFATASFDSTSTAVAANLFTNLAPNGTLPSLPTLDWSLSAGSAARTGGTGAFTAGSRLALRTAGSGITGTTYRGAADPNGTKWWQGWTIYARN